MISLEGQTEIKKGTREKEKQEEIRSGQHKEGTVHVSNKGSGQKQRRVTVCGCGASGPPYPRGLEQLIQSADTLLRNRSPYWAALRDTCSSGHTHSDRVTADCVWERTREFCMCPQWHRTTLAELKCIILLFCISVDWMLMTFWYNTWSLYIWHIIMILHNS